MPLGWPIGQLPSERTPSRTRFAALLILLTALTVSTAVIIEITENNRFHQNQKAVVLERLAVIRAKLEGAINSDLQLSKSLITTIHLQKGMDTATFSQAAALIFHEAKYLRNIGLSRGTVIEYMYPLRGNERAVGMDYSKNTVQWPAVKRAIESRALVVAGPVSLVQGGVGIIGRLPVYFPRRVGGATEDTFYGLLSVVIDIPKLLGAAGIQENDPDFSIAIRGKDGLGEKGEVFFGDPSLFTRESVRMEIHFSDNTWIVAATPHLGWDTTSPRITSFRIAFSLAWLVIMALLASQYREMRLRWEANQRRIKSEERYRTLVEATGTGFVVIDSQGRVVDANQEYLRLTGHQELSQIIGRCVIEWTAPHAKQKNAEAVARCVKDRGIRGLEIDYIGTDGQIIPIEINASVQGEGESLQIITLCRDITERKRAEEELTDSKELFNLFMRHSPIYTYIKEVSAGESRVIQASENFENMVGIKGSDMVGKTMAELFPPEFAEKITSDDMSVVAKGQVLTLDESLDKRNYTTIKFPIKMRGKTFLAGYTIDITEHRKAEEELRSSEERLRSLYENMTEGVALHEYVLDERGQPVNYRIVDINPQYSAILDLKRESVVGKLATEIYGTQEPPYLKEFSKPFYTGEGYHIETYFPPMEKYFDISIAPWGEHGFATIFLDVTEQKRAEAKQLKLQDQLAQSQKIESVGRLAGGVAHDFNNMLGVIIGHTDMALSGLESESPLYSNLIEIQKAANRSADLTRQLLAFARKQTVSPKIIDLNDAVVNALTMLKRLIGENIELEWRPSKDLSVANIDPSQIDQILANLCVNARDAIVGHGNITIETGSATFDADYCAHHGEYTPGVYVMLAISDNGRGMDRETLSNIFEPFFTTKEMGKGTGLGLATVYGIVKQNNGFITVNSEPGSGTSFKIFLPRHAAETKFLTEEIQSKVETRCGETILLVEDEPAVMEMTTMMLETMGYAVLAARGSGEAIRMAREYKGKIDLLMTDVVMPEMNGRDLAENVLAIYPEIKRLFMSGYTADVIAHQGVLESGVNFIQKPFTMQSLGAKLREALEKR